jgi:ADP-ribose pyrophosphatase YjhB (NUDIX family)
MTGDRMSRRVDYDDDPSAPPPTSIVAGGCAVVADDEGRILLQRRADSGQWSLPGGAMDLGETLGEAVVREVREETGMIVELTGIVGVYTNPRHVIAYPDGEVRQEFSIAFSARILGGDLAANDESTDVRFVEPDAIEHLDMHESIRLRIRHYREGRSAPYLG